MKACRENIFIDEQAVCGAHKAVTGEMVAEFERKHGKSSRLTPAPVVRANSSEYVRSAYKTLPIDASGQANGAQRVDALYNSVQTVRRQQSIRLQSARGTFKAVRPLFQGETVETHSVDSARHANLQVLECGNLPDHDSIDRFEVTEMISESDSQILYLGYDRLERCQVAIRYNKAHSGEHQLRAVDSKIVSLESRARKNSPPYEVMHQIGAQELQSILSENRRLVIAQISSRLRLVALIAAMTILATLWAVSTFVHLPC